MTLSKLMRNRRMFRHYGIGCALQHIFIASVFAVCGLAHAQPIKDYAKLKQEQCEQVMKSLSGEWQLDYMDGASDGKIFQKKVDNSKEVAMTLVFSKDTVHSTTKPQEGIEKKMADSELVTAGSKYSFGESPLSQIQFVIPDSGVKTKSRTDRYMYFLKDDSLILILDCLSPTEYPGDSDLVKGEKLNRIAFHFSRIKK